MTEPEQELTVRRPRAAARLLPRESAPDPGVVVSRNVLRSNATAAAPTTDRERRIAGELPAWEPLPPGELFVRRPGHGADAART